MITSLDLTPVIRSWDGGIFGNKSDHNNSTRPSLNKLKNGNWMATSLSPDNAIAQR